MKLLVFLILLVPALSWAQTDAPAADPANYELLSDSDPLVVRGALTELSDVDPDSLDPKISRTLIRIALNGTDTESRELALRLLGQLGPRVQGREELWPRLAELLDLRRKSPPGRIRGWAAWTLGKTGAPVKTYGLPLLGVMGPYDDFSRAAALESFVDLGGDVPAFLRVALVASEPGGIRANIIALLGQFPVAEGGLSAAEAKDLMPTAHRTERSALLGIVLSQMTNSPEDIEWVSQQLRRETGYFELRQLLNRLTKLGPEAAGVAPAVCELIGREHAPDFDVYEYFEAVGAAPEAMCAIPRLENPKYGYAAGKALLQMGGPGQAMLVKWLKSANNERRAEALSVINGAQETPWFAFHEVLRASRDSESYLRTQAASVLPKYGVTGQFYLRQMVDDEHDWTRVAVAENLAGPATQALLITMLDDEFERVVLTAASQLAEVPGPVSTEEVFERVMGTGLPIEAKMDIAEAMEIPLFPIFERLVSDDDPDVRKSGVTIAFRLKDQPELVIPRLELLLDDPDGDVRNQAAWVLEGFGPAAAVAVDSLRSALLDRDWSVRSRAVSALGAIGPDAAAALPDLREMRKTGKASDSLLIDAIVDIGGADDELVADLVKTLRESKSSTARTGAAQTLGRIRRSQAGVDALRSAITDDDEHVRWAAAKALDKVGNRVDRQRARAVLDDMGPFPPMRQIDLGM